MTTDPDEMMEAIPVSVSSVFGFLVFFTSFSSFRFCLDKTPSHWLFFLISVHRNPFNFRFAFQPPPFNKEKLSCISATVAGGL